MRLSKNKMKKVFVFKMVDVKSDFVGTEKKVDKIGCFECIVENTTSLKSDDTKTEKEIVCKLTAPNGYHFKEGFMCSLEDAEKPTLKIISVNKYTSHTICNCVSWT